MDWLENKLKHALRREDPPADFAARVLRGAAGPARSGRRPAVWQRWLAVAAALLVITGSGLGYRRHQGAVAKQKVMLAVRFAGARMNRIQTRVREVMR